MALVLGCHDYAQKGVRLCLLTTISFFLVPPSRTIRNVLQQSMCYGHYNRTPDLGKCDVVEHVGLSKVLDTRREGTRS